MARQSRGRLRLGRMFSPRNRSASAVASAEVHEKRRKTRVKKWRERFKRFSLSAWHESAIVQTVCGLFRAGADTARAVRAATGSQIVGPSYGRQLRIEGLEQRQMLAATSLTGSYFQDFDTLAVSGTSSTLPAGWEFSESGGSANTLYSAGTGSSTTGDTYSFGAAASSERALGGLQSGSVNPTIGASFTNDTGSTITSLSISYTGEQWRLGALSRTDKLDFQYSTDATSLTTGTWTDFDTLDFTGPTTTGSVGALDGNAAANRTAISGTISSLSITSGSTVYIRWNDFNPSGSDDGLAVDDFAIVAGPISTTYVDDTWTGFSNGQVIADADSVTSGNQPAIFGKNAFSSIQAGIDGVAASGTVIVNAGSYAESPNIGAGKTVKIVGAVDLGANNVSIDGTLFVDQLLTAGTVLATNGGILGGIGTITASSLVRINSGGTLATGDSPGELTVEGDVLLKAGSTFAVDINGTGAADHDRLVANNGTVTIESGATLLPTVGYAPAAADLINLIHHTGTGSITGALTYSIASGFRLQSSSDDVNLVENSPPVFTTSAALSIQENLLGVTLLGATDDDMDTPTFSITGGADAAKFDITSGTQLVFLTAPDYEIPADADTDNVYEVQVTADDGFGGVTTLDITVTVTPESEFSPVANAVSDDADEDGPGISVSADFTDGDAGETYTFAIDTTGTIGSVTNNNDGTFTYDPNGQFDYLPDSITTTDTFTYTVNDGTTDSNSATVTITIHGENDAPTIGGDVSGAVTEDSGAGEMASGSLTISDPDNGESNFQADAAATTYGSYTLAANGDWTYTLDNNSPAIQSLAAGQPLADSFMAVSADGTSVQVDITITGVNDAAMIGGDVAGDVTEDGVTMASGLNTVSDVDTGQNVLQSVPSTPATYGSYSVGPGGWSYALDNNNPAVQALDAISTPLTDTFTITSFDGSASELVTITIHGADESLTVVVDGTDGVPDTLTVDFTLGKYYLNGVEQGDLAGLTDIYFNGGAGAGSDKLEIIGGAFGNVTYNYDNTNDGDIELGNGLVVHYTGLEPITNTGTASDVVFNLTGLADDAVLEDDGLGGFRLRSANGTFETTDFAAPSNSLTIIGGAGDTLLVTKSLSVAGSITFDVPTISLDADLTAPTLTGTATTLIVLSNAAQIQDAVTLAISGATINVAAGTFDEDVSLNKDGLKLFGAGASSTTIRGVIGGPDGATIRIAANNLEIAGLTITRNGNTVADWNNPALNTAGIAVIGQALSGALIHDNIITGNRTGIDINNSNGHTVRNNVITDNHTGMIFRNQTDNTTVVENAITDNRTVGIVFLDASGGSNSPVQQALNSTFSGNNISSNWYGQIVDRQSGGSLPLPGANLKNFSGNWFGTAAPVITTANSAEPAYASLIPPSAGGSAMAPGGQPDIAGPASANFDISPLLLSGVDTDLLEFGFQGDYSTVLATTEGAQTLGGRIDEAIGVVPSGGTVKIAAGVYAESVDATTNSVILAPGASPGQVTVNSLTLDNNDALAIEIDGLTPGTQYDKFVVTGTATLGDAALTTTGTYIPSLGNAFTVIDAATLSGTLSTTSATLNGFPLSVTYPGSGYVVLAVSPQMDVRVDDDWTVSVGGDIAPAGLSNGDTVESGAGETVVSGLTFGYNAFATITDALAAVLNGGTIHVLAGTYLESLAIAKDVTIEGQSDTGPGAVHLDANSAFTAIDISPTYDVTISGLEISNYFSTGIHENGASLALNGTTLNGGLTGVWIDGGTLDMDNTVISGVAVFGIQIGASGIADIATSEIMGTATTAAGVIVSSGHADINNSVLSGNNRGMLVNATGTAAIHGSYLDGNSIAAIVNGTATVVDASGNAWGTNVDTGPTGVQSKTVGPVDFTPYLDSSTDTDSGARGFVGDLSHLHVTTLGSQTGGVGRIQEGVDDIEDGALTGGGRILDVHAGTYAENLLVNKSVYLKGANDGTAGSGSRGTESVIRASGNTSGVVTVTANDITISGFTVSGDDPSVTGLPVHSGADANALYAITNGDTVSGAPIDGLTVRDNIIQQAALGVHGNGISGASTKSVIDANLFQDIGVYDFGYAISLRNNFYADITNNVMRRVYTGVLANNFSTSKGSPWLMQGNDIESYAAGLWHNQSYGASTVMTIDGNMFKQSSGPAVADNIGILFTLGPGGNLPTVTGNTIEDHDYGVVVWGTPGGLTLGSTNSISGADTGIYVTNNVGFNPIGSTVLGLVGTPSSVVVDGMMIDASTTGIIVRGDAGGGVSSVVVQNDTEISGAATGILISGPNATATISGNDASIHGNAIGIDVDGGSATITNNHIYDNTTGIRLISGGSATIDDNDFEGGGSPDNGTDILLTVSSGGITGGVVTGNTFAGSTYIRNESPQDITALRDPYGTNFYNVAGVATTNDFTIESRIYHQVDNASSGLVTWVPNTIFVASVAETGSTPTATDNDYTRIKNAIEAAGDGDIIQLLGGGANAFNWTESFAAASWALGNDGVASTADDYSILTLDGLEDVTLTAPGGLGTATILGPGEEIGRAGGFLAFRGGVNTGWTISELEINNFEYGIGYFFGAGGLHAYDDTTITHNHIVLPADVPETVDSFTDDDIEPGYGKDVNVAIHFSFGDNQTISDNIIDFAGDGVSDSGMGSYAASIGMLSDTSGSAYEGLLITGNTLNVLAAQSADPEVIRGIWENGHAHTSNITISDNHFYNLAGGNDPTLNLQRAFTVTSHSSVTTTVTYANNTVDGANMGWQWLGGANFAGTQPVVLSGNTLTNVATGMLIRSNGSATLTGNSFTNSGAMLHVGIGVDVAAGSTAELDGGASENSIVGFDTAIRSDGTVNVHDNNASIHGNLIGIDVTGGTATISGNHIYDNTTGIRFAGTGGSIDNNVFDDNSDNTTDLLIVSGAGTLSSVSGNSFAGDTFFIENQDDQSVDATSDTFDEVSNYRIEDKMHHRVDTDLAVTTGLVTWVTGNLYITDPAINPVSTDSSIQRGIDAALAGNTINVEAGTYTDSAQIVVDKDLAIIGEGKTATIFTKNFDTAASGDARGWWLVNDGVSLELSDVAFDGSGNLTWQAIRHKGAGTIDNVAFTEIKFQESGPSYAGTAVAYFPTAGGNLDVTNSMFSEIGRQGVLYFGTGVTGMFKDNMYTGKGAGDWLDYAVEVGAGAKIDIIGSTISGNLGVASSDGSTSAGVLVTTFFGAGSEAHFSGANVISGNTTGVAIGYDGTDSSVVTVNSGQFKNNTAHGISIVGGSSAMLSVTGATLTGNSDAGILADGANVKVDSTDLTGNDVGIRVQNDAVVDAGGGAFSSIGGNILTGYTGTGGNYAIEDLNLAPGPDVNAQFNDFGPYVNISIIENYVFDDTDDPTRTMVIFIGALNQQPAPSVVFVDDDWAGTSLGTDADGAGNVVANWTGIGGNANGTQFGVDQFATIQDAINAIAPGGSIYVYDGSYVQELVVDRSLSLFGYQAGQDARTRGVVSEAVIQASTASDALIEVSAAGVTIDGFTIDGDDLATRAVRVNEVDDAVVRNNIITAAVRGVQYNGSAGGNSGGLVEQNLIENLTADANGSYGVLAFDASYAAVMNNDMTGLDVGIFEQYFYQPNGGGNAANVISGNDISAAVLGYGTNERSSAAATTALSDNVYTIGAGGVGIQLYNIYKANGITLTNETITGAHVGVYAYVNGGSVSIADSSITGDGTAGSIGVQLTNYLAAYSSYATAFSNVPGAVTISGSDISSFKTGVFVEDADADFDLDLIDDATGSVTATITDDTDISGADTGILVSGPAASAIITGNDASIHGNVVGIDVDGGSATIAGNHIYDNGTGVWFHNGGAGSVGGALLVDGNNFDDNVAGDGADDNATDILIDSSAGTVDILGNNQFAGDTFFIDNQSTTDYDLSSNGTTFDETGADANFRIEDKIHHEMDTDLALGNGLVTWVAGNLYVTDGGTDHSIQRGVDVATAGNTINVEAGTYIENVSVDKSLTLLSDSGRAITTIQGISNVGALGTLLITNGTNDVTIGGPTGNGFTIIGIDNGNPGIENAAVYLQGTHDNIEFRYNDVVANGDEGLLTEFGQANSNFIIDNNIFSGQTFVGPTPADNGFANQFTTPNVPRQLVVMGSGSGTTTTTNITFTNNQITGTAGGSNGGGEQGNTLVTIDALGTSISGNTFSGTTTRFGNSLRARGANNIITGNIFNSTGMGANTVDLYVNRAGNIIQGNTFSSTAGGALQVDGALGGATIGGAGLGEANSFSGYDAGVIITGATATVDSNMFTSNGFGVVDAGSATIVDNTFSSTTADVDVNSGTAFVQDNSFAGPIGVLVRNGGIADLGQTGNPSPSDFTGLGISAGGNDFSSYAPTATAASGAIVDLNTNGANADPGRQGPPLDVTAFGNTWTDPTPNGIEDVVYHDSDDSSLGFVDFAAFGSLSVMATTSTSILEGGSVSISGSFSNVPQAHTITIVWGDSSPDTVINNLSGDFDFSSSHTYIDNVNGTPFSNFPITVTVTDASLAMIGPSAPINVLVTNTDPVIDTFTGPLTAGTGQTKHYTFTASDLGDGNRTPGQLSAGAMLAPSGGATASLVGPVVFDTTTGIGSFDVLFTAPPGGGSVDIKVTVSDDDFASDMETLTVNVGNTLQVTNFVTNPSGFDVTFNREPNLSDLNLYDGRKASEVTVVIDPADIIVTRQVVRDRRPSSTAQWLGMR